MCANRTGSGLPVSKRLAQEFRTLQPVSPRARRSAPFLVSPHPHARDDLKLAITRVQGERGSIERQPIVGVGNAERFGQLAGPRTERTFVVEEASPPHRRDTVGRFQCADQDRAGGAGLFADEIDAPVDAVGAVDIGKSGRSEHHGISRRRPPIGMRRRLGVMVGLEFDDDAADAIDQKGRADQVGRDLEHAAAKEGPLEQFSPGFWLQAAYLKFGLAMRRISSEPFNEAAYTRIDMFASAHYFPVRERWVLRFSTNFGKWALVRTEFWVMVRYAKRPHRPRRAVAVRGPPD